MLDGRVIILPDFETVDTAMFQSEPYSQYVFFTDKYMEI